jgi:redox-sensing transcriptional repressor
MMAGMDEKATPGPTLRRLATYHHFLKRLEGIGREVVSCTHIAQELRLDPTQVRKDIEMTGIVGKAKVGYDVAHLVRAIEEFLGWNNTTDAFLVGAGAMGTALLGYEGFRNLGLNIVAAFDAHEAKIGTEIHGKTVLAIEKLPDLARRMHIRIGIITVPGEAAQKVADMMLEGGVKAIWNFAPVPVNVPEEIILENVHLSSSLAVLSSKLAKILKVENKQGVVEHANSYDAEI